MHRWRQQLCTATESFDAAAVAEWLNISLSAYYKRRRGEVAFTPYQVFRLSERFGLNTNTNGLPELRFQAGLLANTFFDANRYAGDLLAIVNHFACTLDAADTEVLVSTTDIPIFQLFAEPELAALKLYLFESARTEVPDAPFALADTLARRADFVDSAQKIAAGYSSVRSTEIWGPEPLQTLLAQLIQLARKRCLSAEDAHEIFASLYRVVSTLEASICSGTTPEGSAFELLCNTLHSSSSLIALRNGSDRRFFLTFDNPRYLQASNEAAYQHFETYFEELRTRAHPVQKRGRLSARNFCAMLVGQIKKAESKVGKAMEVGFDLY